nr:SGNH hydrolase domain-containing protein [Vibrio tasmaniensis]
MHEKLHTFSDYIYLKISLDHCTDRSKDSFILLDQAEGTSVVRVFPHKLLCNDIYCYMGLNGLPLYYDDAHLSKYGAELVVKQLASHLL